MPFVYILKSEDGRYYIGSTTDLVKRLEHHKGGFTPSTKRMGNLDIVLKQEYKSLSEARKTELKLKKLKRHDYIDSIVKDGFIKMKP
ncbi:MAG: GIY-YIG nuclease family protein [Patescibacteria group bacterium]